MLLQRIKCIKCPLVLLLVIVLFPFSFSQDITSETYDIFTCCTQVFGSCRSSCENLSLVQLAADPNGKDARLLEVRRFCPSIQVDFWNCLNRTLHAVARGSQWSGRLCCPLALSPRCQNACATSVSREELIGGCRQSDEQNLYSCFDKQDDGDECCGNARSSECLQACRDIFRSRLTPSKEKRSYIENVCNDNNTNSKVLQCVQNFIDLTPINNSKQYLPCCDYTQDSICRATCKEILISGETTQEMIDELEKGGCGPPLPHDPMWQCFLSAGTKITVTTSSASEGSQINQIGMDSAKLHCCQKAVSPKCRRLCIKTFSNDWTETRGDFEIDCYSQIAEASLKQCLDEVEEPCELGCDGLSFCTNFNNRPTELFRSCNVQADQAAKSDVALWKQKGYLSLPGLNLPIKDISKCSPEIWQAIVCSMQIKPCTRNRHANQICREDCYDILSKCMDWTRLESSHTASSICSKLSLDDPTSPCVSLKPFIEPSDLIHHSGTDKIISPCKGHPCNATEVCLVNTDGTTGFTCVPGCPLGETSSYLVPLNTYVRIPISLKEKGCLKICKCESSGRVEHCQPLPCISYDSCSLAGRKIEHNSWFYIECNMCSCFAGEITCTKKQCHIPGMSEKSYTSLPCNCPPHYVPVCGKNGNTYPSACVAKCTGLQDAEIEFGPCNDKDPCSQIQCPINTKCVEDRQVCLSNMHRPCQQYQCVNTSTNACTSLEPVCSLEKRTYSTLCHLLRSKSKLDYRGPCLENCYGPSRGPVCGMNGITYKSECDAWSDYSLVDYFGACQEVGLLFDLRGQRCSSIKCESLPSEHCLGIIPPGACCPICAGALRVVYSRKQIDRALYALKGRNMESLTLRSILKELEKLIRISQCRLSGYLTIETDIFLVVQSTERLPNFIQIETCARESEKIAQLISIQSHRITSNLALSSLTVATVVPSSNANFGIQMKQRIWRVLILTFCIWIMWKLR